jgi:hypothetical protein
VTSNPKQSDRRLLEALASLQDSPAFEVVIEHLQKQRDEATADLVALIEPPQIYRAQGAAALLDDFLTKATKAREYIAQRREGQLSASWTG